MAKIKGEVLQVTEKSPAELSRVPLFDQDQGKVIPPPVSFFSGVDIKAVVPGGFKDINAAGFHHRSDPEFG